MRIAYRAVVLLLLTGLPLGAQDFVRLKDGKAVKGEIIVENAEKLVLIDQMGETVTVLQADIERFRKGKPMSPKTLEKLEAVTEKTADNLFAVAAWAAEQKGLHRDAERVARRVLVLDPNHKQARALLGHVKGLDVWYPDAETAKAAVEEKMTADGYVYVSGGWIRAERANDLAGRPEDWLLIDDFWWRPLAEVMTERGYELWRREWYPPDQKHLIPLCREYSDKLGVEMHAAEKGCSRVISCLGREEAMAMAENMVKARAWFCSTFETATHGRRKDLDQNPQSLTVIVPNQVTLEKFADSYRGVFGIKGEDIGFTIRLKMVLWTDFGHAHQADDNIFRNQVVSQLGGRMLQWYWHEGFDLPAWIWIASAHHAEIAVFGGARVPYVARSEYDDPSADENVSSRDIRHARERVKEMAKAKKGLSIRTLFGKPFNAMTKEDDDVGLVLMEYLLEKEKEPFLKFLSGPKTGNVWERWERYFKKSMEQVEGDFKAWL